MSVLIHHAGDGAEFEALNFELVGVFSIATAIEKFGFAEIQKFMKLAHPSVIGGLIKPGLIVSVNPELKKSGKNDVPFGVFMASADQNLQTSRSLKTSLYIEDLRSQFPVLDFNKDWTSWDEVVKLYDPEFTENSLKSSRNTYSPNC